MKFALYQPWIYVCGGLERSLLELVRRSRHEWTVYTGHFEPENTFPEFRDVDVRVVGATCVKRSIGGVLLSALQVLRLRLPMSRDTDGLVVWCDGIGDLVTFRNSRLPLFNICSTPLRPVFDPVYARFAQANRSLPSRLAFYVCSSIFRWTDRLAWRRYRGVFATSTEVRNRIIAGGLHAGGDSMVMAYPGVDWTPQPEVSHESFILLPGRIMWTKNIQQGIRAFLDADLPEPWRLVVAGFLDRKSQPYLEELRELAANNPRIEFIISPDDEMLKDLYRRAGFCLFTPLNEDWGIVPLEAMTYAKAVIANACGGPLESLVDGETGYLLEADDAQGWAAAMRRLALDEGRMQSMGWAGHEHVRRFTWDEFVRIVDDRLENWILESRGLPAAAAALSSANKKDLCHAD